MSQARGRQEAMGRKVGAGVLPGWRDGKALARGAVVAVFANGVAVASAGCPGGGVGPGDEAKGTAVGAWAGGWLGAIDPQAATNSCATPRRTAACVKRRSMVGQG